MIRLIPVIILASFMSLIPVPKPLINPVSAESPKTFLTVTKCNGCSVSEFDRIKASTAKLNEVIHSSCFRDELSNMKLIQTNGKTPAQVVESLTNAEIVIETQMYWTLNRVLGYTLPNVNKEWINRRYLMKWSVCDLGSLLAHETSHKVGYDHDYKTTKNRPYSVPYSVNRAFEKCCH